MDCKTDFTPAPFSYIKRILQFGWITMLENKRSICIVLMNEITKHTTKFTWTG